MKTETIALPSVRAATPLPLAFSLAATLMALAASTSAQTLFVPGGTIGTSSTSGVGIGTSSPFAGTFHVRNGGDVRVLLMPDSGANNRESLVDFWASFDNYPGDVGTRRAGRIQVGFDAGTWGTEYMAFGVGGAGDAQNPPTEVMRLRPGNGGSAKIRVPNSSDFDDTFGLQVGAPIESRVDNASSYLRFHDPFDRHFAVGYNRADLTLRISYGGTPDANTDFVMDSLGRIGLAVANPGTQLDVWSPDFLISRFHGGSAGNHAIQVNNSVASLNVGIAAQTATAGAGYLYSSSNKVMIGSDGAPTFIVSGMSGGKVGIGTTSPTHTLSVNGTIKAREVIVETTGWPDHVFAGDYLLAPLSDVEAHIKAQGHLPGIPSAREVAERGVNVGEMQATLLAKIEELTLYVIDLKKENGELRSRLEKIEALP